MKSVIADTPAISQRLSTREQDFLVVKSPSHEEMVLSLFFLVWPLCS